MHIASSMFASPWVLRFHKWMDLKINRCLLLFLSRPIAKMFDSAIVMVEQRVIHCTHEGSCKKEVPFD